MSSSSALENSEDLENVTLVRMEDVQPDRNSEIYEVLKVSPYVMNRVIDHDYSCIVNDEDSNIGSMVSIPSEDVEDCSENPEFIDHEVLEPVVKETISTAPSQGSWPTLEILPGGVIKHSEKFITSLHQSGDKNPEEKELMYACAKCPQKFNFLYSLVKHVKLHEEQKKLELCPIIEGFSKNVAKCLKKKEYPQNKKKKILKYKTKCKIPKK